MKHLTLLSMGTLLSLNLFAQSLVEKPIVNTSFAEWRTLTHVSDNAAAPDSTRQLVTKKSGETITFTFHQTNLFDGGTGKVSGACDAGSRYVCGMKNAEDNPATLTTSAFASVTKISFTACVSGSNRGWGVRVKGDGDEDWVVVYNTLLPNTNRTDITVDVNRTNVQIQWYNLVPKQYTTFSNLKVYGMVEDDGMSEINYFDLNGKLIGTQTVTTGSTFVPLYGAADLVIPEGMAFRGWNENGVRIDETQVIDHDMDLRAYASAIETAQTGSYYSYNLSQPNFYPQDHDLLDYRSAQEIGITVSSKVYVAYTTSDNTVHSATYYADQDVVVVSCEEPLSIKSIEVYNVKSPIEKAGKHYSVAGGDAASFLMVVNQLEDGDTIYLANGQYDLGERVLTTIARNNIVIMGESMDGVIIRNTPPMSVEGINTTATIFNTGTGNRYENLTLHNALDYYTSIAKTNSGRAVCLQDKGNKTVCYRVRMLSYQDTYYSNHVGSQHYFEECEIHGTVDFVCGDGSVYFYNCLLYCEPRKADGSGTDCITASNASAGDKGYVFDRCTIQSKCPVIS
ncbi:MAG: pectinesterase family protein, partial [Paludibacteraceae bacterium]|nr:pectinesterase family protein [Paludibacteraceae bacterium]